MKKINSSWYELDNRDKYIVSKQVDLSIVEHGGATIPLTVVHLFEENLLESIEIGSSVDVDIIYKDIIYENCKLDRVNVKGRENKPTRIFFSKDLRNTLINGELKESYELLKSDVKFKNNASKIDKENRAFINFYSCYEKNRYKIDISFIDDKEELNIEEDTDEIILKNISNSWYEIIKGNELYWNDKYIVSKQFDLSVLGAGGCTLPKNIEDRFKLWIKDNIKLGESTKISISYEGKEYKASFCYYKGKYNIYRIVFSSELQEILKGGELKEPYEELYNNEEYKNKPDILEGKLQRYVHFYYGEERNIFEIKVSKCLRTSEINDFYEYELDNFADIEVKYEVEYIDRYIKSKGFFYEDNLIKNIYISLKTKPFVILSGISGTGKSKVIELIAEAMNANYKLIPVKADWSDSSELLGYKDIEGRFIPGDLTEAIVEARQSKKPYFICLDEMNIARVEYYFSDILSLLETRRKKCDKIITNTILSKQILINNDDDTYYYNELIIPENLYIIGTVNMDETTFQFSRKVLDRANTIEFNSVNLDFDFEFETENIEKLEISNENLKAEYIKLLDCREEKETANMIIDKLKIINKVLEKYNNHFGYRVRDEIVFYILYSKKYDLLSFEDAFDLQVLQKILPKIEGSSDDTKELLIEIYDVLVNIFSDNIEKNNQDYYIRKLSIRDEKYPNGEIEELLQLIKSSELYIKDNEKQIKIIDIYNRKSLIKVLEMLKEYIKNGYTTFYR